MSNADKKVTVGNIKAFLRELRKIFMPLTTPQELRAAMGLGDTLGPLEEEYGGTGDGSFNDAVTAMGARNIGYAYVAASEFYSKPQIKTFRDAGAGYVGVSAFYNCTGLEEVDLPSCSFVGSNAFDHCSSLREVSAPSCTTLYSYAFYSCTNLSSVNMPMIKSMENDVFAKTGLPHASFPLCTAVGYAAFQSAASLSAVSLPACTDGSYQYTFASCTALTDVYMPKLSVTARYMFASCTALSKITLEACTSISGSTFLGCTALQVASFPKCQVIDYGAFQSCSKLSALILASTTVCRLSRTEGFGDTAIAKGSGYIYVPSSKLATYKASTNWSNYSSRFSAIENMKL